MSQASKAEIEQTLALGALILGATGDWKKASAASLRTLFDRVSALRVEEGELSIVEVVAAKGVATTAEIDGALRHRVCPHSKSSCRFMTKNAACGITNLAVAAIVEDLVLRKVLVRTGAASPHRYAVSV